MYELGVFMGATSLIPCGRGKVCPHLFSLSTEPVYLFGFVHMLMYAYIYVCIRGCVYPLHS